MGVIDGKDDREVAHLYKLAAEQGDASAQVDLGSFYSEGHGGLPQDDREALRFISSPPTRETPALNATSGVCSTKAGVCRGMMRLPLSAIATLLRRALSEVGAP
jgi:hypothetical protein